MREEPVQFPPQDADHKSLQGLLGELFQMADNAKNSCSEAFIHLNEAAIMTQHQTPEFGLDFIKFITPELQKEVSSI
jgi:hypothetical protein